MADDGLITNPDSKEDSMRRGPIPLNVRAALEPLIALVIFAAPWLTRWDRTEAEPTFTRERRTPAH
ncbi:MAG TPA: hypothetical protein VI039_00760 [Solirubrobacterales bacterium]